MTLLVTHDYENAPPIFGANEEIYEDSGTKAFNFWLFLESKLVILN